MNSQSLPDLSPKCNRPPPSLPPAPFSMQGMTEQEVEAFMANLPTIIAIHEKVQKVLDLFRNHKATVAELQRTLLEVVRVEYTRRKLALEKSLQHGVRSRHLALNDKYVELMDYVGCPWIQSVLPVSLACDDLSFWITRIRYNMPKIRVPSRLRELAGLPPDTDDLLLGDDIEDGRPEVEPMKLKRRSMSTGYSRSGFSTDTDDEFAADGMDGRLKEADAAVMKSPSQSSVGSGILSTASTALRTVQMSIIMGFKVPLF